VIIKVRVVPGSGRRLVKEGEGILKVYLTKPAIDGQANKELVELLSGHFKVKIYQIQITRGEKARDKVIEINA
jgi:uncharacterized protein (TIGR00251 family)